MKRFTLSLLLCSQLIMGCTGPFSSKTEESLITQEIPLPERTDIEKGTLKNGMNYIVLPNQKPKNRVSLQLVVHAGSVDEDDDQKGIAHLVEHMAFNGTQQYPGNAIIEQQESLGMVFGRDVNAMTSYNTTSYYLHLPDNSPSVLAEGFNMLAQQTSALTFEQTELEKERPVVEEEWRRRLNVMSRLNSAKTKHTLKGSRYAVREPIGDMELVRHVDAKRIKAFWQTWYHPNNMTLLVAGDVTRTQIENLLERYFSNMPSVTLPERADLSVPLDKKFRYEIFDDPEITTEAFSVNLRGIQAVPSTEQALQIELLNHLVMSMLDDRLLNQFQVEGAYVSKMFATALPLASGYSNNNAMAILKNKHYKEALQSLFSEVSRYHAHGFSQRDLKQAKKSLSNRYNQMASSLDEAPTRNLLTSLFNQIRLQKPLVHPNESMLIANRLLDDINLEMTHSHLKQIIAKRIPLIIGQINSDNKSLLPSQQEVETLWNDALKNPPKSLKQAEIPKSLFEKRPKPVEILAHDIVNEIHKWTLANGVQVWFHPSDKSAKTLKLRWQGKGGTILLPPKQQRAASMTTRYLARFGYGGFSPEAIAALNSDANMRINAYVGQNIHGIFGTADTDDYETWLQNLNLMLTAPSVDKAIWQSKRDAIIRSIERRKNLPTVKFNDQINKIRYANNPSLLALTSEQLSQITTQDLLASYQALFTDSAHHQLVIVGNESPERVIDLASRYLGNLPVGKPLKTPQLVKLSAGNHEVKVVAGKEPQAMTTLFFNVDVQFSQALEYEAALLSRIISNRMREKLREEAGGVYTTNFSIGLDKYRNQAFGMLKYSHQPERAVELKTLALKVMNDVAVNGVTLTELNLVREQIKKTLQSETVTDRSRYQWLTQQASDNKFKDYRGIYLNWLTQVEPKDLQPFAQKVLTTPNVIDALLLPSSAE